MSIIKIKIEKLVEMADEIDGIFHKNGFIVDHDILASHIFGVIKLSYFQDDVELERPDLTHLLEKHG